MAVAVGPDARDIEVGGHVVGCQGREINQGMGLGGFAEQALVHENQLARVPKEITFPQAALIGCGVVTGAGAVLNTGDVQAGDSVVIIGTGGVGLNAISGAVIAGASKIIAVDIADDKLETARQFGANHVINSTTGNPVDEVMRITGAGAEAVFDFVGVEGVTSWCCESPANRRCTDTPHLFLLRARHLPAVDDRRRCPGGRRIAP